MLNIDFLIIVIPTHSSKLVNYLVNLEVNSKCLSSVEVISQIKKQKIRKIIHDKLDIIL